MPCVLWFAGRKVTGRLKRTAAEESAAPGETQEARGTRACLKNAFPAFVLCIRNN